MKFAHFADCHIGGWQDPRMKELTIAAFRKAIDECMARKVDFLLIAGDLFNSALPQIDLIKDVAGELKRMRDAGIAVYIIAGSHDFSPSRKTMLDVLEKAGLCTNVMKVEDGALQFTVDPRTNAKITGILGRSGGLEREDYGNISMRHLELEQGFKIFMFHTALEEFKPAGMECMEAQSVAALPRNFHYYAGGHVHYIFDRQLGSGVLTYPGALFPNNFKELEEFKCGGMYVVDESLNYEYVPMQVKPVVSLVFDADNKSVPQLSGEISASLASLDAKDKIVTVRVAGELASGKPSDVDFKSLFSALGDAYFVMKNTSRLSAREELQSALVQAASIEEVESKMLESHREPAPLKLDNPGEFMHSLIRVLDKEKADGEKSADFGARVLADVLKVLGIDED